MSHAKQSDQNASHHSTMITAARLFTKLYSRRLKSKHNCYIHTYIYIADGGNS